MEVEGRGVAWRKEEEGGREKGVTVGSMKKGEELLEGRRRKMKWSWW